MYVTPAPFYPRIGIFLSLETSLGSIWSPSASKSLLIVNGNIADFGSLGRYVYPELFLSSEDVLNFGTKSRLDWSQSTLGDPVPSNAATLTLETKGNDWTDGFGIAPVCAPSCPYDLEHAVPLAGRMY